MPTENSNSTNSSKPERASAPYRPTRIHDDTHYENCLSRKYFKAIAMLPLLLLIVNGRAHAQGGHPVPTPPPPGAKSTKCSGRPVPQLEDITARTGITFRHTSDPSKKYIVESMSGGVILFDYDRDGWLDIYFTNAPTVDMAVKGRKVQVYLSQQSRWYLHRRHCKGRAHFLASRWVGRWAIMTMTAGQTSTLPVLGAIFFITTMATDLYRRDRQSGGCRRPLVKPEQPSPTMTVTDSWI